MTVIIGGSGVIADTWSELGFKNQTNIIRRYATTILAPGPSTDALFTSIKLVRMEIHYIIEK